MNAMNFDAHSATPAQRTLVRLLKTALTDDVRAARAIHAALTESGEGELPFHADDLLDFVKAYLVPLVRDDVGPKLVMALIDDLEAEIEQERALADPNSSSRMGIATRMPPQPVDDGLANVVIPRSPSPPLDLGPPIDADVLDREPDHPPPPQTHVQRDVAPPTRRIAQVVVARPMVILVDPDRFGRASLARALVQGRIDVRVLDSAAEVIAIAQSTEQLHVVITEVDGLELDAMLASLVTSRPEVPIIAWTKSPKVVAEHVLHSAGVQHFEVVAKSARAAEIVELIRRHACAG